MSDRTDTERLNWLEAMRADVFAVVGDEWDVGSFPQLIRFSVEVDYYKTRWTPGDEGESGGFLNVVGNGPTLREAIDDAIIIETRKAQPA